MGKTKQLPSDIRAEARDLPFEAYAIRETIDLKADQICVFESLGQRLRPIRPGIDFGISYVEDFLVGDVLPRPNTPGADVEDAAEAVKSGRNSTSRITDALGQPTQWSLVDTAVLVPDDVGPAGPPAVMGEGVFSQPVDTGRLTAAVTQVTANIDELLAVFDEKDMFVRAFRKMFWNGTRVVPAEEFSWLIERFSAEISVPGGTDAHRVAVAIAASIAMVSNLGGKHQDLDVATFNTHLEFPVWLLPAARACQILENVKFPTSGFSSDRPANWPSPANMGKYVRACLDIMINALEEARRAVRRIPKVLSALAYATYYRAEDTDFDFGELDRIINLLPPPMAARQPSLHTQTHLESDARDIVTLLRAGTARFPSSLITLAEYATRFDVFDHRRVGESGGVFAVLAITPRIEARGQQTITLRDSRAYKKGVKSAGPAAKFMRKLTRMAVDSAGAYEQLVQQSAGAIESMLDTAHAYLPAHVGPTASLYFGGSGERLFYYTLAMADRVRVRLRAQAGDNPNDPPELTDVLYYGTRRNDAPILAIGVPESEGQVFETKNAASLIALSASRASGLGRSAWAATDELVSRLTQDGKIRLPGAYRVTSRALSAEVRAMYPEVNVHRLTAGGSLSTGAGSFSSHRFVVQGTGGHVPLTGYIGQVAEAANRPLIRLYITPTLDLAYYYQAELLAHLTVRYDTWQAARIAAGQARSGDDSLGRWPFDDAVRRYLAEPVVLRALETTRFENDRLVPRIPRDVEDALALRYDAVQRYRLPLDRAIFNPGAFRDALVAVAALADLEEIRNRLVSLETIPL